MVIGIGMYVDTGSAGGSAQGGQSVGIHALRDVDDALEHPVLHSAVATGRA